MQKTNKIVLRKRIRDYEVITGFEKLTKIKLPNAPIEVPAELHCNSVTWFMNMERPSGIEEYKKLLSHFDLPFKTNGAKMLYFSIKRLCWWDILFEVFEAKVE